MIETRPAPTSSPSTGRFREAMARTGKVLLRLFLAVLIGGVLGVAVYWGAVLVYEQYIFPMQEQMIRLDAQASRREQADQQASLLLDDYRARLEALEVQGDTHKQAIADLGGVADAQATRLASLSILETVQVDMADVRAGLKAVQAAQEAVQASFGALEATREADRTNQTAIQAAQDALRADLDTLRLVQTQAQATVEAGEGQIGVLAQQLKEQGESIVALETEVSSLRSLTTLSGDLQLVKVMELLTRSRFLLAQHNLGLAGLDIQAGRDALLALQAGASADQAKALGEIIARLDAAMANLPNAPVAAADELEGAWRLLARGLPVEATATPLPTVTPEAAVTPTPAATGQP